ncbi:MAG TPA: Nramp family divalent metal transporter [Pyrinomonadaceae bacterium]|nr:Nramp family divalent metal transporter [Pyrinomonadaceae bacterium]
MKRLNRFRHARLRHFFRDLGPGLITGAADDDPSGISTYSVAGASFGYGLLWAALFSFPLMAAVQLMCARLGMVTGLGLAGVVRRRYSAPVLWGACALLIVANTFNIGADLGGMAEVMQMMTGVTSYFWLPLFTILIVVLLVWLSYKHIAKIFKWLTIVLFSYVIAAFLAHPRWGDVLKATFIPQLRLDATYVATILGVLGTTISPYLFFWQAAQEVEEERAMGRRTIRARLGATDAELRAMRTDVLTGMAFAGIVMYFIIVTTGATLYATGQRDIETARQAAEALRPLAGNGAYWLFTLGLVGTGMLGVPVLAGSAAYAVAEAMHWRGSLEDRPRRAPKFYAVLAVAVLLGLILNYLKLNAVRMLFWAAVLNGMLAPPLIILVTLLSSDRAVMGARVNPLVLTVLGWLTAAVMLAATVMMFVTWRM